MATHSVQPAGVVARSYDHAERIGSALFPVAGIGTVGVRQLKAPDDAVAEARPA
jgi:hypothetical protein